MASKSSVLLRRIPEDSPETTGKKTRKVTLYKKKQKEVSLEDIQMEQISSDEDEKEENVEKSQTEELKLAPEVVEKVPEIGNTPENTTGKIPEDSEAEKKNLDDSIKSENSTKEDATKKDETKIEKEERKRKKSERKEAKRAKKEAKKAKKEKKRADRERKKSERDEKR